ncbi:MAG: energy-coupling factor ABC transporter ATP-binding protein [Ardenticatenaceae bacterium]
MKPILEFKKVWYSYSGQAKAALSDLTLQLPQGQRVAVLGRNGSGKSTLFRHCNGQLKPDRGTLYFDGQPMAYDYDSLRTLRKRVGVVSQNPDEQMFSFNVRENLAFGLLNQGLSEHKVNWRVQQAAALCEVTRLLDKPTHALSSGEKVRVGLASVMVMNPEVLLIDEPTANLDPWMRREIFAILGHLYRRRKSLIVATHEVEVARHWADFVVFIEDGRVVVAQPSARVFANKKLLKRMGIETPWYMSLR